MGEVERLCWRVASQELEMLTNLPHNINVKPHPLYPVPGVSLRDELDYAFYKDNHDSFRDPK